MGILDDILASKREEVAQARRALSIEALRDRARAASAARGFAESIRNGRADTEPCAGDAPPRVVAEIKRASPSAGLIREDFDPAALARGYAALARRPSRV